MLLIQLTARLTLYISRKKLDDRSKQMSFL